MASHESLYPLITIEAMGCPAMAIDTAINRAAAEFCAGSLAWQEDLDAIYLSNGVAEYDLDLPRGSQLVVIRAGEVKIGGRALIAHMAPERIDPSVTGNPSHYYQRGYGSIALYPKPADSAGQMLTVRAVLKPTLTTTTLPDVLVDRYYEAIAEGAKAILKRIPNQPWSDPAGAGPAYQLFKQKTAEARISSEHGNVAGSMKVRPRRYGG